MSRTGGAGVAYYHSTAMTALKISARISAAVLEVLDRYGETYFDYCDENSAFLQNRLEEAIGEAVGTYVTQPDK